MAETLTTGSVMRPMREERPGIPLIAPTRNCLGAESGHDVHPDAAGSIGPIDEGMSVVHGSRENLKKLPKPIRPYPYGESALQVFEVEVPDLLVELETKKTSPWHAVIQPRTRMLFVLYNGLLASTQPKWKPIRLQVAP